MRRFLPMLCWIPFVLSAQPTITASGAATATAGSSLPINFALAGSTGLNITALEWTFATPANFSYASPAVSAATSGVGKGVYCNASNATCVVLGVANGTNLITNTALADGVFATLQLTIAPGTTPGAVSLPLSTLLSTNTSGVDVIISPGATYTVTVLSKCDANGDGKIDGSDVQLVLNAALGRGSCPLAGGCTLNSIVAVLRAALGQSCSL